MFKKCIYIIVLFVYYVKVSNEYLLKPHNCVNQGELTGKYMYTRNGKKFSAYLGIPYAKPPIGDLRFKAPVSPTPWLGVLNATEFGPMCPQGARIYGTPYQGNENCLFLNLYTPQLEQEEESSYAVMIFIHGGGFALGTGQDYGPDYLLDENVILVTINYRLGPLGFFSTGNEIVPGNNGLKDQTLAIKWVHQNIKAFGGDSKRITLFGVSSGGVSVHYHMFSPLTKGLFHAGISQSGTVFGISSLMKSKDVVANSKQLAEFVGCPANDPNTMIECLRTVDAKNITEAIGIFALWDVDPVMAFMPIVENNNKDAFLPDNPINLLKTGKYANVPWICGMNSEEGLYRAAYLYLNENLLKDLNQNFSRIMRITLDTKNPQFDIIGGQIREFYFGNKAIDNSTVTNLAYLYSDIHFVSAVDLGVRYHLQYAKQPVYYYVFSHQGRNSFSELFGSPPFIYGTCHMDELIYMFPLQILFGNSTLSQGDLFYSNLLTKMWTNFAKECDPTPKTDAIISTRWKPVKTEKLEYYNIGGGVHTASNVYSERVKFWTKLNKGRNLNIRE